MEMGKSRTCILRMMHDSNNTTVVNRAAMDAFILKLICNI